VHHAEQVHREFTGWMEAQGYHNEYAAYGWGDLADAFAAGWEAADAVVAQPAPELAAAFPAAKAALARVLSWFPVTGTRNEATATRAQLAHAYQDGGLDVPEELRRFL
jgi:uncharacterized membrane protein